MTLLTAHLITASVLLLLGALLLISNSAITSTMKAIPRSQTAAVIFFGIAAAWFLYVLNGLAPADEIIPKKFLIIGFGAVSLLSFYYVPDFLAVRGLCALMLLGGAPLLASGYMNFEHSQIVLYKIAIFLGILFALFLGWMPYKARDILNWLFVRPHRARALGGIFTAYGLLITAVAFSY
jgi:hypothetical protein